MFSLSSSLPPLVCGGGGLWASLLARLICRIILTASSPVSVDLPFTCHPSPRLTTFAFRSSEVRRLLLDLDPYGGSDPFGTFHFFLPGTADVLAHVLVLCFGCLFFWAVSQLAGDGPIAPQFQRAAVSLCCQPPHYFHNISIVKGV